MRVIVGLGNTGERYAKTRHNIGFLIVDEIAAKVSAPAWQVEKKFKAQITEAECGGDKLLLVKPQTMMNLSGESARAIMDFYKLEAGDFWVAYDEIDLPYAQLRLRQGGSSGGHNGLKSLISHIGENFHRIRFGIEPNDRMNEPSEVYVLKPFLPEQQAQLPKAITAAATITLEALRDGIEEKNFTLL